MLTDTKLQKYLGIITTFSFSLVGFALLAIHQVLANNAPRVENYLKVDTIAGLLHSLIAIVLTFATPIIIFFIIYAGFLYVTARGNEQQLQQANRALLYAIVGGLLILGAYVLITIVSNLITAIIE
ncbi:hypothetical protein KC845_01975 [Candidatus Kaiserbacteria bacterium]|nr:hypothetical protein [Candidatus Kaiserbacteria bacterium]